MPNLKHHNTCFDCEFYDSDANDYYYEYCQHPEAGSHIREASFYEDASEYIMTCPKTGTSPYTD